MFTYSNSARSSTEIVNPLIHAGDIPQDPRWLNRRTEISKGAPRLYHLLKRHSWARGYAFVRQEVLAKEMDLCVKTIGRYVGELRRAALLNVIRRRWHRANVYQFFWHPWMVEKPTQAHQKDPYSPPRMSHQMSYQMSHQKPENVPSDVLSDPAKCRLYYNESSPNGSGANGKGTNETARLDGEARAMGSAIAPNESDEADDDEQCWIEDCVEPVVMCGEHAEPGSCDETCLLTCEKHSGALWGLGYRFGMDDEDSAADTSEEPPITPEVVASEKPAHNDIDLTFLLQRSVTDAPDKRRRREEEQLQKEADVVGCSIDEWRATDKLDRDGILSVLRDPTATSAQRNAALQSLKRKAA